jgi:hypothetical protein
LAGEVVKQRGEQIFKARRALEAAISDAIVLAEKIMTKIDSRSATESVDDFECKLSVEGARLIHLAWALPGQR